MEIVSAQAIDYILNQQLNINRAIATELKEISGCFNKLIDLLTLILGEDSDRD